MIKADLHIHTVYSGDSRISLDRLVARCTELGINCIAVTDHNTIEGALEVQGIAPFKVIVGEEILTSSGEVMGYFLKEGIPRGLPVRDTVRLVREQGGLVCVPHPFDRMRGSTLRRHSLEEILPEVDIIETLNARALLRRCNLAAERCAVERGLPASAGSDAHTPGEIGSAYVEMPDFEDAQGFLSALAKGKVCGDVTSRWVHVRSSWAKVWKVLR